MQRLFDIIFSSLTLLMLTPVLLPIVIILKFSGEGEVFFLQDRIGQHGKKFKLFKLATMLKDSPNIGSQTVTMKGDPRILPVGMFLRKTKVNELPQLLNIFLGDMSVIGPRPQAQRCFDAFPKDLQEIIIRVKPGLSGIGSIIFRAEEDILAGHAGSLDYYDQVIAPYKGSVEAWYVNHHTLWIYFLLIAVTIWVVIFSKSTLVWKTLKSLPPPPDELKVALNYYELSLNT